MKLRAFKFRLTAAALLCALAAAFSSVALAQATQQPRPFTSDELVRAVRQLPQQPALREQLVAEIRRRGIAFPLTSGLLSLAATKSGNDASLRRALEEAERRRLNPESVRPRPSEEEANQLLARAREVTLAASKAMPDFVVRQQVVRYLAMGTTKNWSVQDRLTLAVSYRESVGEQYRLLAVNGMATGAEARESGSYFEKVGGTTSTGEYVGLLAELFGERSKTEFQVFDAETLRNRPTVVYDFRIKQENSRSQITFDRLRTVVVGVRGRVWVDRETYRVLRLESFSTDIPTDFPITATSSFVDYDWVDISGRQYLLPVRAVVEGTQTQDGRTYQRRNDIRFRGYQKYGTEIKIIEEDIVEDEPPPEEPKSKP
ncbi:MAG TPA: hypothetical protein VEQ42_06820 [Pyrinomonadaceae bacterium]|nr:hypothetical protein [Pyrinomonadaceae bacterium]